MARGRRLERLLFDLPCHKQHSSGQKVTKVGLWKEGFSSVSAAVTTLRKSLNLFSFTSPLFACFLYSDCEVLTEGTMSDCSCAVHMMGPWWHVRDAVDSSVGLSCLRVLSLSLCGSGVVYPGYLYSFNFFFFIILS